jgi:hypothetical protein
MSSRAQILARFHLGPTNSVLQAWRSEQPEKHRPPECVHLTIIHHDRRLMWTSIWIGTQGPVLSGIVSAIQHSVRWFHPSSEIQSLRPYLTGKHRDKESSQQ